MALVSNPKSGDDVSVRQAIAKLGSTKLGPTSTPTYAGLTLTGLTINSLIYPVVADDGTSTGALTSLGAATDGQLPIGDTDGIPILATLTGTANEIDITNAAGSITIGIVNPLIVAKGGIGVATLTDHGILLGSGTDAVTPLGVASNGQLPIGSAGTDPVLATLTGTAKRVTITNGAGTITLSGPQDIDTVDSPTFAGLTVINAITEFSTDGTMGGNSDSAVPTEKATKLYTDTLRSDLASTANAKGASLVGVEDSAAQFDAADVEAALSELMVLVTPVEYNPAMSRTAGGDAGGDDNSVATIDDADSYDTDEVSATPGFDIQAVFSGVTDFNQVQIHTAYDGNPAHVVRIDLDKTPFDWSSYDTILADIDDNSGNFIFNAITVASAAQYINSGEVRLRFYHSSAGNATHDFFIDYCALWKTGVSVGVTEHGGLTGLDDVSDHPSYLLLDGSRALAGAWDMGNQALTNVNIDSGDINVAVVNTEWDAAYSHSQVTHDYAYISGNDGATDVSAAELEELTDGSATVLHSHAGGADVKVGIDVGATAGFLGAANNDGVLRTDGSNITYADGGNFVTLTTAQGIQTTSTPQFARIGLGVAAHASIPLHISDGSSVINAALITSVWGLISAYDTAPGFSIVSAGPDADDRAVFQGIRSDGTLASPTVPAVNDKVLSFLGSIYDGVDTEGTAAIDFIVDGAVSSNVAPQRISFSTSATNAAGRLERLTITKQGLIGINTASIPHGGIGSARLAIDGPVSSAGITHATAGPHVQFTVHGDNYPVLQLLNYAHDNINLNFDSYFSTAVGWVSSDTGSCFSIAKTSDALRFRWDVAAQGAAVTWNDGIIMNNAGAVQINGVFESVGVATLADGSTLKTSAAPTADAEIANKKYVDDNVGGVNHAILDGSVHTDSVADAVTRGSIIYGNATPKWDELVIGGANTFLGSDGTDVSYRTAAQVMASLSGAATAAFDLNGQNLTNVGTLGAGNTTITGTLDVTGNIDPTSYETTRGGFKDEDLMGSDSATVVCSQQSIKAFAQFNDAGDIAGSHDYDLTDFTTDGTWRDWDLSGEVPAGAKEVTILYYIADDAIGSQWEVRENGNSNEYNTDGVVTQVANISVYGHFHCALDANRVIEYRATNLTWSSAFFTIRSWRF